MLFCLQMLNSTMLSLWIAIMCFVLLGGVSHGKPAPAAESTKTVTVSSGWGESSPPFFIVQPKYVQVVSKPMVVVSKPQPAKVVKGRKTKNRGTTFTTPFTSNGWGSNGRWRGRLRQDIDITNRSVRTHTSHFTTNQIVFYSPSISFIARIKSPGSLKLMKPKPLLLPVRLSRITLALLNDGYLLKVRVSSSSFTSLPKSPQNIRKSSSDQSASEWSSQTWPPAVRTVYIQQKHTHELHKLLYKYIILIWII